MKHFLTLLSLCIFISGSICAMESPQNSPSKYETPHRKHLLAQQIDFIKAVKAKRPNFDAIEEQISAFKAAVEFKEFFNSPIDDDDNTIMHIVAGYGADNRCYEKGRYSHIRTYTDTYAMILAKAITLQRDSPYPKPLVTKLLAWTNKNGHTPLDCSLRNCHTGSFVLGFEHAQQYFTAEEFAAWLIKTKAILTAGFYGDSLALKYITQHCLEYAPENNNALLRSLFEQTDDEGNTVLHLVIYYAYHDCIGTCIIALESLAETLPHFIRDFLDKPNNDDHVAIQYQTRNRSHYKGSNNNFDRLRLLMGTARMQIEKEEADRAKTHKNQPRRHR